MHAQGNNGPPQGVIRVRNARQHNLQGLNLDIPLEQITVVTGLSGAGKSSLVFDTIYAEGQRRYVETFSSYARQFLDRMDKPLVDAVEGIPPAIAIEQRNSVRTSRSTVGTMTEIADFMKLYMPHVARLFCDGCGREVRHDTPSSVWAELRSSCTEGEPLLVSFEIPRPPTMSWEELAQGLIQQGFLRVWSAGAVLRLDDLASWPKANKSKITKADTVEVIQDRLSVETAAQERFVEAAEAAFRLGHGVLTLRFPNRGPKAKPRRFSTDWACADCARTFMQPSQGLFSFNNPLGACPVCKGFGRTVEIDPDLVVPDPRLSLKQGAIRPWQSGISHECQLDLLAHCKAHAIPVDRPFNQLSEAHRREVMEGGRGFYGVTGFFDYLQSKAYKLHVRVALSRYRSYRECTACGGSRLRPEASLFRLGDKTLPEIFCLPVRHSLEFMEAQAGLALDDASVLLHREIVRRLRYLVDVGLGYLTLDRTSRTLSGGELQRVNLTSCLGTSLVNTLFVLDEPSIGMHPADLHRVDRVMRKLRDQGNTLLLVEHDESIIRGADHVIDLGPGRGITGGKAVFQGTPKALEQDRDSLTGAFLRGERKIPVPSRRRLSKGLGLRVLGARGNNLQGVDITFPKGTLCCLTGVSGSGKSTLLEATIWRGLQRLQGEMVESPAACDAIEGWEQFDAIELVDQSPIVRTPRSNPAIFLGIYDSIRTLFAATDAAQSRGLTGAAFSFNSGTGRCDRCRGAGFEKVDMQFLSDVFVTCPECEGRRFKQEVLQVRWRDKSIDEVLQCTVTEAIQHFKGERSVTNHLRMLEEVGLGYLPIGQPLNTLSGGEAQRLKLLGQLKRLNSGRSRSSLILLDEPTTGLHLEDVRLLLLLLHRLVDAGNTLIVVEHHLDVLANADFIIDLGPGAGDQGGRIVTRGTPEEVAAAPLSITGRYLAEHLAARDRMPGSATAPAVCLAESTATAVYNTAEPAASKPPHIRILGAREHNLKNLNVDIPRDAFVVVTGVSGSGKSTLAFDVLFAEGQRRFLDSMSAYVRQYVQQMTRADVDLVEGIPPTVAIEQRVTRGGRKSTVGTVSEILHYFRLMYARIGLQHCPDCMIPVASITRGELAARLRQDCAKGPVELLAPLVRGRKGIYKDLAEWAHKKGFQELRVDGKRCPTKPFPKLDRYRTHSLDLVLGHIRAPMGPAEDAIVEQALDFGQGTVITVSARGEERIHNLSRSCPGCGRAFEEPDPLQFSFNSPRGWCPDCRGYGVLFPALLEKDDLEDVHLDRTPDPDKETVCTTCGGARLKPESRSCHIDGLSIVDLSATPLHRLPELLASMQKGWDSRTRQIAEPLIQAVTERMAFLEEVGLSYLTLDRSADTLSGGEGQRIRLAAQLGSNLQGVLYVLDEPTIGLHPHDNERLLDILRKLQSRGNSLLVVEHDEDTMRQADTILDLGPFAGEHGGTIVAQGNAEQLTATPASITGRHLLHPMRHPLRGRRRGLQGGAVLQIRGACLHNLKDLDCDFPIGRLSAVTGVSGSGKSTLIRGVLKEQLKRLAAGLDPDPELCASMEGWEEIDAVYEVDQTPVGKTPRSTPATYVKAWDGIRALFAQTTTARVRGYDASRFSFNNASGQCPECKGQGILKIEMNFLPDMHVHCEACKGRRFTDETQEVLLRGKSISDCLEMTISEAEEFFRFHPKIHRSLKYLEETGLGYLRLGQPTPTLSGGEAQRLKLVKELARSSQDRKLFLLEEPSIGLHMEDIQRLIEVLHQLVDRGHTVVIIEHNMDLVAEADYVLDIGPGGGTNGGRIMTRGTPEQVARRKRSVTAPFLKKTLDRS